jgi:predicted transcriptional regulator
MTLQEIITHVSGTVVAGDPAMYPKIDCAFASDLMSDVLTITTNKRIMLITGLANLQTIRTCEMSDIKIILFARGKKATEEMIELAEDDDMVLIETPISLYETSGILYNAGLLPVY